jgi:type II secretory pathway pseudopilin PulG
MTNVEARRNNRIRIISTPRSRLRHSGFDIPSSFVIRTSSFRAEGAVTIIELLVVIIIILILAGLILSISSYVQNKGARARAETEIAAMSAALESYKADNGIYPGVVVPPTTSAPSTLDPTTTDPSSYISACQYLYVQLSGDSDDNPTTTSVSDTKNYLAGSLKPNMLKPSPPGANTYIRDPFGNSYGYSTAKASNPSGAVGNNPTFDLWSTGGSTTSDTSKWIKNW